MIGRLVLVCLVLAGSAHIADAQTTVQATSPTLAEMLQNVYGPHGLVVDSEAVLPDGSTHSAHFNGAFQSEFGRVNIALVQQLGALPIPSPASGFTYSFDSSTGTFVRSTQSFGPILADRAETIGRGRFAFGMGLQQFSFGTFDGLRLSHIPAVFTHDDFDLGGGRSDVITTTVSLTYGATEHLDLSIGVPLVNTSLSIVSNATIHRLGTESNPAIHFFRDPDAPATYGSERTFVSQGTASGLGDVIVRGKETLFKKAHGGLAVGVEARLPTGDEENLLGSGALGVKVFSAASGTYGHVSPHVNVGYQWNGSSLLAGDIAAGVKGDLPNELSYVFGADVGVERRLSIAFDVLGRYWSDAQRLASSTFTVSSVSPPQTFDDVAFRVGSLNVVSGSFGLKANIAGTLLATFNLEFKLNDAGLRTKVTPLVGLEYSF
jgi:hypothetical protein